MAHPEYFLIPDDAVEQWKLGFYILLFIQQFKASLEQFYIYKKRNSKIRFLRVLKKGQIWLEIWKCCSVHGWCLPYSVMYSLYWTTFSDLHTVDCFTETSRPDANSGGLVWWVMRVSMLSGKLKNIQKIISYKKCPKQNMPEVNVILSLNYLKKIPPLVKISIHICFCFVSFFSCLKHKL